MSDKTLQERLRNSVQFWHGHCDLTMEAADRISALEADAKASSSHIQTLEKYVASLESECDELAAVVREVADSHFDLSLHKQHDTLSYLKHIAQKALAKLEKENE